MQDWVKVDGFEIDFGLIYDFFFCVIVLFVVVRIVWVVF